MRKIRIAKILIGLLVALAAMSTACADAALDVITKKNVDTAKMIKVLKNMPLGDFSDAPAKMYGMPDDLQYGLNTMQMMWDIKVNSAKLLIYTYNDRVNTGRFHFVATETMVNNLKNALDKWLGEATTKAGKLVYGGLIYQPKNDIYAVTLLTTSRDDGKIDVELLKYVRGLSPVASSIVNDWLEKARGGSK